MSDEVSKKIDPYATGILKGDPFAKTKKRVIKGHFVVVSNVKMESRGYKLIVIPSRALLSNEIHELITTDEIGAKPGQEVNRVGVIGFIEIIEGGVVAVGDLVRINQMELGIVAGFDETHIPNHINIIVKAKEVLTGFDLNVELEDKVLFER